MTSRSLRSMISAHPSRFVLLATLCLILVGCKRQQKIEEVQEFIAGIKVAQIQETGPPINLQPIKRSVYSSAGSRSPFERPPTKTSKRDISQLVAPDLNRERELLESFSLSEMKMVGFLALDDQILALVEAESNKVFRVNEGNYLGQNHGRIIAVTKEQIDLIEIVPSGDGGWVERPQILELQKSNELETP